jgi:galactose oxidase
VSWIRLASVTHSFDQNQRLNFLTFAKGNGKLTVTAPTNANIAPPGHYMLFVLNQKGVPSIGQIIRIFSAVAPAVVHHPAFALLRPSPGPLEINAEMIRNATTQEVTIGITPTCPYGLAVCWGGAHDALNHLSDVKDVRPIADGTNSTAFVYMKNDRLPDLDVWADEFTSVVNGSYLLRGIEMTLEGPIEESNGLLTLTGAGDRPTVLLAPLDAFDKVQWNLATHSIWPVLPDEQTAYERLTQRMQSLPSPKAVKVTGPLKKNENGYFMEVREFTA